MTELAKVKCNNCNKSFYRPNQRFNEAIKFDWNQFCSKKCQSAFKTKVRVLQCENCGKNFEKFFKDISAHNFCSRSCAAITNNKKYDHRRMLPILKTCICCGKNYRKSSNNKKYCSIFCRNQAATYNKEKIIEIIKNTAGKLKRVPARREFWGGVDKAAVRLFGSWNKAVSAAGLIPNRSHNDRMYKKATAKAMDGHLCDSISELLVDNWLYKNNILHDRNSKYPNTNHKADWKILSKDKEVLVEYFGLANDSPRYDRCIKEKLKICRINKIPLIAIYPKDLYPKNFSEDNLKNKFKDFLTA